MNIIKKFIKYNFMPRTNKIKYIVIHDTGNIAKDANAEMHYRYFNGGKVDASADFFVDDKQIIQTVDYSVNASWHCGDGKGKNGITNQNSIGIEMCINVDNDRTLTTANTIELVKVLMKELNIKPEQVVRHFDASGKNCPATWSKDDWKLWKEFKQKLEVIEVPKHYAEDSLQYIKDNGIIIDSKDYDKPITRGAVFVIIAQVMKVLIKLIKG